jgi:hypothetical protein
MIDYFTPPGRYSIREVRKRLQDLSKGDKNLFSSESIDGFIQQFWYQDIYDSILMVPWVFEMLLHWLKLWKRFPSRFEFYSKIIDNLTRNDLRVRSDLHKVAVHFELIQQNELPKDLFIKSIHELRLSTVTVAWLKDRLLIEEIAEDKVKELPVRFKWFHHSFTEYLAADNILSSDKILDNLQSLMIVHVDEDNTDNIKPSWNGTLGFLLLSGRGNEILEWLVSHIERNPLNLFESIAETIVLRGPDNVNDTIKDRVFRAIYGTIQDRSIWIRSLPAYGLWRFYTNNQRSVLEKDCRKLSSVEETYIHRGNAVAYFTELVKHNKLPASIKKLWKPRLIQYAMDSNTNGVLQRYTLDALELYDDQSLVDKLKPYYDRPERKSDQLLSQAFIEFCSSFKTKKNVSVEVLIDASKQSMDVYGRHGLQELINQKEIEVLLHAFNDDSQFLERFIDSENIFAKEDNEEVGDGKLVSRIIELSRNNSKIWELAFQVIVAAVKSVNLFDLQNSHLIRRLASELPDTYKLITKLIEGAKEHKDDNHIVYKLLDLFPVMLTKGNWRKILLIIEKSGVYPKSRVDDIVYQLRWRHGAAGKELFSIIAPFRNLEITPEPAPQERDREEKNKVLKEFRQKLEPSPGQYMTDVFEYYVTNAKVLDPLSAKDKKRILFLAFDDQIKRLVTNKFEITLSDFPPKTNQFSWSRQAAYYGDMVRVVQKLEPKKLDDPIVQKHLINFIPFTYSDDLQTLCEVVIYVTPEQFSQLNEHLTNPSDHRRYFIPESYISFVEHLTKTNNMSFCLPVLKSLVFGDYIDEWVLVHALGVFGQISVRNDELQAILRDVFTKFNKSKKQLAEEANRQLIEYFQDKRAIKWRITQIKKRLAPFQPPRMGVAHTVSGIEEEFESMKFAKPIVYSQDPSVFKQLFGIYKNIFEKAQQQSDFLLYRNYVWKLILSNLENYPLSGFILMSSWLTKNPRLTVWMKEELRQLRLKIINRQATVDNL